LKIAVVDGQGGGIGKVVVEKIKKTFAEKVHILALGTNTMATAVMLKAGANAGATGENAIVYNAPNVDMIIGSIVIISGNSLFGELTAMMANAISDSNALKILIPLSKSRIEVAGNINKPLPHYVDDVINLINQQLRE
jgi:Ni,Fe-hydrogenase maturation factor